MSFFIYPAIKRIIISFPFKINLSPFVRITFSILNSWIFFFYSFSWKVPTISSPWRFLIIYVHSTVFLTFLITKTSWGHLECNLLQKYFYIMIFQQYHQSYIINIFTWVNICVWFYINRFHFNCSLTSIILFINYII